MIWRACVVDRGKRFLEVEADTENAAIYLVSQLHQVSARRIVVWLDGEPVPTDRIAAIVKRFVPWDATEHALKSFFKGG